MPEKETIISGIPDLDRLLEGILIGDNVIWYDDAGSLAPVFCLRFMEQCLEEGRPVIYASFDRSPRNLLERLGSVARHPLFILMDCFTLGKGRGSPPFVSFYEQEARAWPCRIHCVDRPGDVEVFMDALYRLHSELSGVVGFVFESLTGMQELWGGEENMARFYTHSCPRLYELRTVAYWIMEKKAHSPKLRAQVNQIAQVVIELAVKRGTTTLTVLKAEGRKVPSLGDPVIYWTDGPQVVFGQDVRGSDRAGIGRRLRHVRTERGLSQTELARLVGVTPSSISQVESNLIYPSVPALLKMAEVLQVPVASFFGEETSGEGSPVLCEADALVVKTLGPMSPGIRVKAFAPWDFGARAQPYLIELDPGSHARTHFFKSKGHELGCVVVGTVAFRLGHKTFTARKGDVIDLAAEIPEEWQNTTPETARLFWVVVR
ncbi:MAG: helix-turn-helix domain-containing protein [Desulfosoma sp.]